MVRIEIRATGPFLTAGLIGGRSGQMLSIMYEQFGRGGEAYLQTEHRLGSVVGSKGLEDAMSRLAKKAGGMTPGDMALVREAHAAMAGKDMEGRRASALRDLVSLARDGEDVEALAREAVVKAVLET